MSHMLEKGTGKVGLSPSVLRQSYTLRVAAVSLALLLATVAAVAFAPRASDVAVAAQEPNGSQVARNTPITITFSRPVDQRSAERSFVLYPPVRGRFQWRDDRTMVFVLAEPLKPRTTYRVTIRSGLQDARGRPNRGETSWPFRTTE
jgi:hypothetical protein